MKKRLAAEGGEGESMEPRLQGQTDMRSSPAPSFISHVGAEKFRQLFEPLFPHL